MFLTKRLSRGATLGACAPRRVTCAVATAMVLAGVGACSSDGGVNAEGPVASGAAATATPTLSSDEAAILAAYREFFARQTEISMAAKEQRRMLLEPFTTDPALERVLRGMFAAEEIGEVGYGEPVLNPAVQSVDGDTATVTDCQDTSKTGRKNRGNGKVTTRGLKRDNVSTTM
ncbi:hypothetical protein, partial [Sporichthya polymorpha]|uniref:hypothetical protein n=1 Tax=Sporichthya polymorpha TaxID=35751 RepID=UPI00037C95BE